MHAIAFGKVLFGTGKYRLVGLFNIWCGPSSAQEDSPQSSTRLKTRAYILTRGVVSHTFALLYCMYHH